MSKYDELGTYLKTLRRERVQLAFADIERITQTKLPPSAHKHRPWWSNNPTNSVLTRVWLDAGFVSEQVDMAGRKLVFRRVRKPDADISAAAALPNPFHPAYGSLKGLVRILPGTDLAAPADPDWAQSIEDAD